MSTEATASVMGTTAHVIVRGGGDADACVEQLRRLERRWSRFIDHSELSRIGRLDGSPAVVSFETALLIDRSVEAWRRTGGLFDPTMLDRLEVAGYDRSFELLESSSPEKVDLSTHVEHGAPAMHSWAPLIESDLATRMVRLPPGTRLDPGGIGKGLAADLGACRTVAHGADGALVSVGGDLRVAGTPPADGWEIELDHHVVEPARLNLRDGAVATSTRLRRRWRTSHGVAHHVIDPRTGRPSEGPAVGVSVVAGDACWAEAIATAVLVGFGTPGFEDIEVDLLAGAGALVTTADRRQHRLGPLGSAFLVSDRELVR